jgi:predicted NAD-dependent protein-ADP-ribosyltransferase YbiA (DUF1768 family)
MSNVIRFYEKKEPYYEFSNFYLSPFQCDGKTWLTSEHYFQANKFTHCPTYYQYISECDSPLKVFSMARQKQMAGYHSKCVVNKKTNPRLVNDVIAEFRNVSIVENWESVKETIMKKALLAKFQQNVSLKALLVGTGSAILIEASPRDNYWGEGKLKNGQNRLGHLLMEVRQELQ